MKLSNTAVPKYYGQFRDRVIRGEIPVNEMVSLEMNRIDQLIENPGVFYDEDAVEGIVPAFRTGDYQAQIRCRLPEVPRVLKIVQIDAAGISLYGFANRHSFEIRKNRVRAVFQCGSPEHVACKCDRVRLVEVDGVVFEHGELGVVDASQLLAVAEAFGNLEYGAASIGKKLLDEDLRGWNHVEFAACAELVDESGPEVVDGRLGDEVCRQGGGFHFKVASVSKKGSDVRVKSASGYGRFSVHASMIVL